MKLKLNKTRTINTIYDDSVKVIEKFFLRKSHYIDLVHMKSVHSIHSVPLANCIRYNITKGYKTSRNNFYTVSKNKYGFSMGAELYNKNILGK